jgi:hypothetical protein
VASLGLYLVGVIWFLWQPVTGDREDRVILAVCWPILALLLACSLPFVAWNAATGKGEAMEEEANDRRRSCGDCQAARVTAELPPARR